MQTFLPFSDFKQSADVLDMRRLGKQRVEVLQLLIALHWEDLKTNIWLAEAVMPDPDRLYTDTPGWVHHPAAKMWRGFEFALTTYGMMMCAVWRQQGFSDRTYEKIEAFTLLDPESYAEQSWLETHKKLPSWLGNEAFHRSHRSNLIRKMPKYYVGVLHWDDPSDLPYIWPE